MSYVCTVCKNISYNWNRGLCPKCKNRHVDRSDSSSSSTDTYTNSIITDAAIASAVAETTKPADTYSGGGGSFGGAGASSSWSDSSSSSSDSGSSCSSSD